MRYRDREELYSEIARIRLNDSKTLVFSEYSKGGFTAAQEVEGVDMQGKKITFFLKGGIHINDLEILTQIRDTMNVIIDTRI